MPTYLQPTRLVLQDLKVSASRGLRSTEITHRRQKFGSNDLVSTKEHLVWRLVREDIRNPLVLLLLIASAISVWLHHWADALMITIALVLDFGLSLIQIWRSEQTLQTINHELDQTATIRRDGRTRTIAASALVVGDIIELQAGQKVPADARIITSHGLQVREAILTGESADVKKTAAALSSRTPIGNRSNMVFMGTAVTSGSGIAVITDVGSHTEFGKIAQLLQAETSPTSPLRRKLTTLSQWLMSGLLIAVFAVFCLSIVSGTDLSTTIRTSITLIVSVIPEDLTVILTIVLTIGLLRILKQRGVVRELNAAETLGATTVICVDKTGTLTRGEMQAKAFDSLQGHVVTTQKPPVDEWQSLALTGLAINTDAHRAQLKGQEYLGSATERSALYFAEELGFNQTILQKQWRQRDAIHFSSIWKYRASVYDHPTQASQVLFVTGAPEIILHASSHSLDERWHSVPLTSARRLELQQQCQAYASQGERLLAVGVRRHYSRPDLTKKDIHDLTFIGVLRITDPIRPEVHQQLERAQAAGVTVKLLTGDYAPTAMAIAREVGLTIPADSVMTGEELADLSDREVSQRLLHTQLFARVTPLDKQRVVRLLQAQGEIVAMTGDGINDAVALKSADIGVAMGSGSDIAKEAADLVLLDNSFSTIVAAIAEGRVIRDNIRRVLSFLLSTNIAEVLLFIASLVLKLPLPLLPAQILWINLVTDGTSDIALAFEPAERHSMHRPPEDPQAPLFTKELTIHTLFSGLVMTVIGASLYWYLYHYLLLDLEYVRTMLFGFVAVSSIASTWSYRSLYDSLLNLGRPSNIWVPVSALFSLQLQLLAMYAPPLQRFFGTVDLNSYDWVILGSLTILTLVLVDFRKLIRVRSTTPTRRRAKARTLPASLERGA